MAGHPIKRTFDKIVEKAKRIASDTHRHANQLEFELVQFKSGDKSIGFNVDLTAETVWATQQQIADLYERDKRTISEHIQAVLAEGELDENSVVRKFRTTASDGKVYEITHYDLDMILAVGFRVKSPKAALFRKWAYQTLRSYVIDGYAINEARLRADQDATTKLAATLRGIRSDEKNIYASVREYFKIASSDYDSRSRNCKAFYATLQDKFHYAVTGQTASQLLLDRADHKKPAMGIQNFDGNYPSISDAQIGKNYLDRDELYTLHILSEQFLLYIESRAIRNKSMTMAVLSSKLDELLNFNEYPVFKGYKDFLKDKAVRHAQAEYAMFLVRLKNEDVKALPQENKK